MEKTISTYAGPAAAILVLDADSAARQIVADSLRSTGSFVSEHTEFELAVDTIRHHRPDLVVIGAEDSYLSPAEKLAEIRRRCGRDGFAAVLATFDSGHDSASGEQDFADIIVLPCSAEELVRRIRVCLAKLPKFRALGKASRPGVVIDHLAHRIFAGERELELTPRCYDLMKFLVCHPDRTFSREELLHEVWSEDEGASLRTVDVHICRLRSALKAAGHDHYLQTVRQIGYRYSER